jgi:hypothetical protein
MVAGCVLIVDASRLCTAQLFLCTAPQVRAGVKARGSHVAGIFCCLSCCLRAMKLAMNGTHSSTAAL